jgi:5-hydroxyisourate hydrolase
MGHLSTHVLDTASGKAAQGVAIALHRVEASGAKTLVLKTSTNADGRTDAPLLAGDVFTPGDYELTFSVGDYFRRAGLIPAGPAFLETVPVRFQMTDPNGRYHVPLVCSPWAYSTYRGS